MHVEVGISKRLASSLAEGQPSVCSRLGCNPETAFSLLQKQPSSFCRFSSRCHLECRPSDPPALGLHFLGYLRLGRSNRKSGSDWHCAWLRRTLGQLLASTPN